MAPPQKPAYKRLEVEIPNETAGYPSSSTPVNESAASGEVDIFGKTLVADINMSSGEFQYGNDSDITTWELSERGLKKFPTKRRSDDEDLESILSLLQMDPAPVVVTTNQKQQSNRYLVVQITPILLIAVAGSMVSGWLLDGAQTWTAFRYVSELFILVPIMMNLKGNLEVNLSSRLSTLTNLGALDNPANRLSIIMGNIFLLLFQTLLTSFVAGILSALIGALSPPSQAALDTLVEGSLPLDPFLIPDSAYRFFTVVVTGMLTAFAGSAVIGMFSCITIYISYRCGVDPDNVAIPLTSSFGDMSTVVLLSRIGQGLFNIRSVAALVLLFLLMVVLLGACFYLTRRNKRVASLMYAGWPPLIFALGATSVAGVLLRTHVHAFAALAPLLPVLNGTVGNVCTIYASRISTHLHAGTHERYNPVMWVLFLINLPVHWFFLLFVHILHLAHGSLDWKLWLLYTTACATMMLGMLLLARYLTIALWKRNYDPDNYTNPFL
ncbi:hypothetical protein IWQ61_002068 [Dispira simplex]|nr:hypothetical protein IWQ61_002068 [Dispira simplex]